MTTLYFDRRTTDAARRARLFAGDLFVHSPNAASLELIELAKRLLLEAFDGRDPRTAQHHYPVQRYAEILSEVKPRFIHHPDCKRLIPRLLAAVGCDLDDTYFDVPRLRTSTSDGYLTTGIAYAFDPHRDTWYSAPMCQVNWWLPIYEIEGDNAMAFHPEYWDRPAANNSWVYDYQRWNATSRFNAVTHVGRDTRVQPELLESIPAEPRIVAVTPPGGLLAFSAAQLHSSIPNHSGVTRLSIDFRVVNASDAAALGGAPNLDSYCTGSAIDDYLRGSDLSHLPESIQGVYRAGHPQPPRFPAPAGVERSVSAA